MEGGDDNQAEYINPSFAIFEDRTWIWNYKLYKIFSFFN